MDAAAARGLGFCGGATEGGNLSNAGLAIWASDGLSTVEND